MKNTFIKFALLVATVSTSMQVFADTRNDLSEGKILASMKMMCDEKLETQLKNVIEIHRKVSLSDSQVMDLQESNSSGGYLSAIGQLEFVSSQTIKDIKKISSGVDQAETSIDDYCAKASEVQRTVEALANDVKSLGLK